MQCRKLGEGKKPKGDALTGSLTCVCTSPDLGQGKLVAVLSKGHGRNPSRLLLDTTADSVPSRKLILLIQGNNKLWFAATEGRSEWKSVSLKNNVSWDCDCILFLGAVPAREAVSPPSPGLLYGAAAEP